MVLATFIQGGPAQVATMAALGDPSIADFLLVGSRSNSKCKNGRTLASEDPGSYSRIFKLNELLWTSSLVW